MGERVKKIEGEMLFTKNQIIKLMIPLIIEQTLTVTVGIADSMMVSVAGEAAVAGVALVDSINNLILQVLAALATGGAVVCSQYMGKRRKDLACQAANQLILTTVLFAVLVSAVMLIGGRDLLRFIFGETEVTVMDNAVMYCMIIVMTYPFMGIYNSAAALFRSMGNSKISMRVSLLMNMINVAGNAILIFGYHMGVAGAALATLASRIVGSGILLYLSYDAKQDIHVSHLLKTRPQGDMIKKILFIGVPTGFENGIFQLGKLCVLSLVSSFGTASIMANSVSYTLCSFMIIPGVAVGLAIVTVAGQCFGANKPEQARYYTNRLSLAAGILMAVVSFGIVLARPFLLGLYHMSQEAYDIASVLLIWHMIAGLVWPLSFNLPNALRAAGDVKFTLIASMASMWIFRVIFSYILGGTFGLGVYGVWIAMFLDWFARTIVFVTRYHGDRWYQRKLV